MRKPPFHPAEPTLLFCGRLPPCTLLWVWIYQTVISIEEMGSLRGSAPL